MAVRAIIRQANGEVLPGEWGDSDWPPVSIRGKAVTPEMLLDLPPGETWFTIGKGPDYLPQTIVTNLESGRTHILETTLEPVLDLYGRGWRSGDAHVHFFHGDGQVARTPEEAYAICAAAGLNFCSFAGEHFGAPTLTREEAERAWRPYQTGECRLWLGAEAPKNAWGHHASILYDPWPIRDALPYQHGIHAVHRQGGVCFPVHPDRHFPFRSFEGEPALFPLHNFHKFYPIAALSGHLLDAWSGISDEPSGAQKLAPYFKLLELGHKIPLLADSDFCMDRLNNGLKGAGFWMNYFQLEGAELTRAAVCAAIRKGRAMCTTGPLVLFEIGEAISGDILPADGAERTVRIRASHRFNPWTLSWRTFTDDADCRIDAIELIRNGTVVRTWRPETPEAEINETLSETEEACYMVRVLGNQGVWMAGYASPIYFAAKADAPRRLPVFKMLVNGRLYDARTGLALTGTVSSVRYGRTDWTVPTDGQGRFRAMVPIDAELRARDGAGRELARGLLDYEPAYSLCHYLPEGFTNKAAAIEPFAELIREMTWEFPLGFSLADSYARVPLDDDLLIRDAALLVAPPRLAGKKHAEIAMLLADKTRVQPGDLLNCAVIYRLPESSTNHQQIALALFAWDPRHPRMYSRYGTPVEPQPAGIPPTEIGSGYFLQSRSFAVPDWAANWSEDAGGLRLSVAVREGFEVLEDANLIFPIGQTRRELLVSSTWDGLPAGWGDRGHGPCQFFRESYKARHADHRQLILRIEAEGRRLRLAPLDDTAHAPDAEDALFVDHFYYDGQCEPEHRNVPFRDRVRPQPPAASFEEVPLSDPPDRSAPEIALMEPLEGERVTSPVRFYFHVEDAGLSGASHAVLLIDGAPVASNVLEAPVKAELAEGEHVWQIEAWDRAGNPAASQPRRFVVGPAPAAPPIQLLGPELLDGIFGFRFVSRPGLTHMIERAEFLDDWRLLLRTNTSAEVTTILDRPSSPRSIYRVRAAP